MRLSRLPYQRDEPFSVDRLLEEVVRAELHRLRGGGDRAVPGQEDDLGTVGISLDRLEDLEPVEARHAQIEDRDVEDLLPEGAECLATVGDLRDVVGSPAGLAQDCFVQQ